MTLKCEICGSDLEFDTFPFYFGTSDEVTIPHMCEKCFVEVGEANEELEEAVISETLGIMLLSARKLGLEKEFMKIAGEDYDLSYVFNLIDKGK